MFYAALALEKKGVIFYDNILLDERRSDQYSISPLRPIGKQSAWKRNWTTLSHKRIQIFVHASPYLMVMQAIIWRKN